VHAVDALELLEEVVHVVPLERQVLAAVHVRAQPRLAARFRLATEVDELRHEPGELEERVAADARGVAVEGHPRGLHAIEHDAPGLGAFVVLENSRGQPRRASGSRSR